MAIKAYTGIMGSGKTYEVVTSVIVPALARGRRVVSNIAGLNIGEIRTLLVSQGIEEANIGELVSIQHEAVLEPLFWRSDIKGGAAAALAAHESTKVKPKAGFSFRRKSAPAVVEEGDDVADRWREYAAQQGGAGEAVAVPEAPALDFFIQPGDLVALDEIWRFWQGFEAKDTEGNKRPDTVMNFVRMHRHFTHPKTGVACDLVLITQDVADIGRTVRGVVEETYYMEKLTAVGSTKRYRVDIFPKTRTTRRPLRSLQRSYDPKMFPLYTSHSQKKEGDAHAVEENVDKRGNILSGALFKIVLPVGLLALLGSVYLVWGFFHPKPATVPTATAGADKVATAPAPGAVSHAKPDGPNIADEWRVLGFYQVAGRLAVVLSSAEQVRTVHQPQNVKIAAGSVEVVLPSGDVATSWTGGRAGGLLPGGQK